MLNEKDLAAEKKKDYQNILVAQFLVVAIYFLLEDIFLILKLTSLIQYINMFFLLAAGIYFFLLWDMVRNYTENKFIIRFTLAILMFDYIMGLMGENPFYKIITNPRPHYFFLHSTLMIIEWVVISFAIKDLFAEHQSTSNKLWCSAALYFMIGITFGSMYDIINIINPGSFGKFVPIGFHSYIEGIYYSLQIQSAGSPPYSGASSLHKGLGVLQAVWSNLYMVLLIGRILVLPEAKKA